MLENTKQSWDEEFEGMRQDASTWIDNFLVNNPISTAGALREYRISKTEPDGNGDAIFCLTIPFWTNNRQVMTDVLAFLVKLNAEWPSGHTIYLEPEMFVVSLCYHACDPD